MAITDIYEIVDTQTMYGQKMLNVYFYEQTGAIKPSGGTPNVAAVLAGRWVAQILDVIKAAQTGDLIHTSVRVRNLFDDSDQYEALISLEGLFAAASGNTDKGFVAVGFKEALDVGSVRPGSKRIAGVPNGISTDGVITDSSFLSSIANVGDALVESVLSAAVAGIEAWVPVVIKRILVEAGPPREYRLPETLAETVLGGVIDAIFNPVLTSQVSRKVGVGE